jgi:hypothetical protein
MNTKILKFFILYIITIPFLTAEAFIFRPYFEKDRPLPFSKGLFLPACGNDGGNDGNNGGNQSAPQVSTIPPTATSSCGGGGAPPPPPPDAGITNLRIRTFICKNRSFDLSFLNEYLSKNPNYQFAPSTTYASQFYNEVASSTCPESQRNRPVEFYAKAECFQGSCGSATLKIIIEPTQGSEEKKTFETTGSLPLDITRIYTFNYPFTYRITAQVEISGDSNAANNARTQTLRVFDYMCLFGFCSQNQRDLDPSRQNPVLKNLKYKTIKTFKDTDSPCRFWRNVVCKGRFGF